jgi:hypothetical protein
MPIPSELIANDTNIIDFDQRKIFNDIEKMFEGVTKESRNLHSKFRKKITSMYIATLLLYGKPVEITTIENLASDLHDQFFDVKDNLPNLPKALNTAMDMAEHLRWKGFSEISKEDFTKMFNDLVRLFKEEVSSYIDVNFEDIEVTVFIESDAEFASDDAVESYAEENDIEEKDIDDAMREELERKAFAETKIDMIKEFIFTII